MYHRWLWRVVPVSVSHLTRWVIEVLNVDVVLRGRSENGRYGSGSDLSGVDLRIPKHIGVIDEVAVWREVDCDRSSSCSRVSLVDGDLVSGLVVAVHGHHWKWIVGGKCFDVRQFDGCGRECGMRDVAATQRLSLSLKFVYSLRVMERVPHWSVLLKIKKTEFEQNNT